MGLKLFNLGTFFTCFCVCYFMVSIQRCRFNVGEKNYLNFIIFSHWSWMRKWSLRKKNFNWCFFLWCPIDLLWFEIFRASKLFRRGRFSKHRVQCQTYPTKTELFWPCQLFPKVCLTLLWTQKKHKKPFHKSWNLLNI